MPESVAPSHDAARASVGGPLLARCRGVVERVPRKLRLLALGAGLVFSGLALYTFLFSASATLNLVCRHNLRSAELSVFLDGKLIHSEQISGAAKKRFGLFDSHIEGSYSKSLAVSAGRHVVQVRLRSAADGFDLTKAASVNVAAGKNATLLVTTPRGGMSLAYQGPLADAAGVSVTDYFGSLRTLLITVFGSALSAAIGFVVQDFLRSRKAPCPVESHNS